MKKIIRLKTSLIILALLTLSLGMKLRGRKNEESVLGVQDELC